MGTIRNRTESPAVRRPSVPRRKATRFRPRMRDDTGAQAAEYAMLGGVSAAACGGLVALLREPDTLRTVLEAVLGTIGGFVGSWF